jgi:hypothetical protein
MCTSRVKAWSWPFYGLGRMLRHARLDEDKVNME